MPSIFSKIVAGEAPAYKVAEDEDFLAFLSINPLMAGHTLVVLKTEIDDVFDIDDFTIGKYMQFTKKVARAVKKAFPCAKVGMSVVGLEVRHAHIHLIPVNSVYDIDFKKTPLKFSPAEMQEMADKIRKHVL